MKMRTVGRVAGTAFMVAAIGLVGYTEYERDRSKVMKIEAGAATAQTRLNEFSKTNLARLEDASKEFVSCLDKVDPKNGKSMPTKESCAGTLEARYNSIAGEEHELQSTIASAENALPELKGNVNVNVLLWGMAALLTGVLTWFTFPWGFWRKKKQDTADNVAKTPESVSTHS